MFRRWHMHSSECCHYFSTTFCYKVCQTLRRDPSEVIWRGWLDLVRLLKLAYLRRLRKANFGKKSFRNSAKKCNMSPGVHISPVIRDWEGKGPWAIVPLTWKMAHQSLWRMIRNGPLKISKSSKKAENGPLAKISSLSLQLYWFLLRKWYSNTF